LWILYRAVDDNKVKRYLNMGMDYAGRGNIL